MSKSKLYDVYSTEGVLLKNVTSGEIEKVLGIPKKRVPQIVHYKKYYQGLYRIDIAEDFEYEYPKTVPDTFWEEWVKVTNLFKKVQWVKYGSPDAIRAKKLTVSGGC